jgi:hypothetical protein
MSNQLEIELVSDCADEFTRPVRRYSSLLTADVNDKGVLDIDTVKGCTMGMAARPERGCYDACYAATIAKFRGIDFSRSVVRTVQSKSQARQIEKAVKAAPEGFFRIGTMGDPCHAWETTVETVEWLSPYAVPVIVTKHWIRASDEQFLRLIACGAILNTSVSALDRTNELKHRERQMRRYESLGGHSVARVVSCEFIIEHPEGARMNDIQNRLLKLPFVIDNPLRVPATHHLVTDGIIRLTVQKDLNSLRTISIANPETYTGPCEGCPDKCGLSSIPKSHPIPKSRQSILNYENKNTD